MKHPVFMAEIVVSDPNLNIGSTAHFTASEGMVFARPVPAVIR
jgi:hypothetical protein